MPDSFRAEVENAVRAMVESPALRRFFDPARYRNALNEVEYVGSVAKCAASTKTMQLGVVTDFPVAMIHKLTVSSKQLDCLYDVWSKASQLICKVRSMRHGRTYAS